MTLCRKKRREWTCIRTRAHDPPRLLLGLLFAHPSISSHRMLRRPVPRKKRRPETRPRPRSRATWRAGLTDSTFAEEESKSAARRQARRRVQHGDAAQSDALLAKNAWLAGETELVQAEGAAIVASMSR